MSAKVVNHPTLLPPFPPPPGRYRINELYMTNKFGGDAQPVITTVDSLQTLLQNSGSLRHHTVRGIDFREFPLNLNGLKIDETTIFIGCRFPLDMELDLHRRRAYLFEAPPDLPYAPFRASLYTWQELMEGFAVDNDQSVDWRIYQHFEGSRYHPSINEALWQRLHDFSMDEGLRRLLSPDQQGLPQRRCVGFMGGHGVPRTDAYYQRAVHTAKLLTEAGYFVVSGGGPGIMEAANLGAYLAGRGTDEVNEVLHHLAQAPTYRDRDFHRTASDILAQYRAGGESLAIPTWFYGHEPSNLFATYIAKYFSNSIREDTLLAISVYGIVFAPGSAGTTQEIFMDAAQNHYVTYQHISPMVFLGRQRYEIDTLIYPLLRQLAHGRAYSELLYLTDEPAEVVAFIQNHPPRMMA